MIVVGIIGVLASTSLSEFRKYKKNAYMVEGLTGVGMIQKSQRTYYVEHGNFAFGATHSFVISAGPLMSETYNYTPSETSSYLGPDGDVQYGLSYKHLGHPFAPGKALRFYFVSLAAKTDETGTFVFGFQDQPLGAILMFGICPTNKCLCRTTDRMAASDVGIQTAPAGRYDRVITIAGANFDVEGRTLASLNTTNDKCSFVMNYIEIEPDTGVTQSPMIQLKE